MERLSRRTLLALAPAVGGAIALGACGQVATAPAGDSDEAEPEAKQPAAEPEAKIQDVIVWHHGFPIWDFTMAEVPKSIKADFDANSGYTMVPEQRPNGGFGDVATVVAAGTAPDVVKTQSWIQNEWAIIEVVRWLSDYIKTAQNVSTDDMWPDAVVQTQYQGQTSALPYSIDTRIMYVNPDQYLQEGLDPENLPATWEAMDEAVGKTFKGSGDQITQLSWDPYRGSGGVNTWMVPYWQLGGEIFNDEKTKFTVNNEMAVQALQWHMRIYDLQGGWLNIQPFHTDKRNREQFGSGEMTHYYEANATRAALKDAFPEFVFAFGGYPQPAGGRQATYTGDWAFCLPNGSENPDGGFAFLDFMYSPDVDIRWANAMDRIPVRKSVAQSDVYIQGDPFKELVIGEMEGAHFWTGVPAIRDVRAGTGEFINSIREGRATIQESLAEYEQKGQTAMDDWAAKLGS